MIRVSPIRRTTSKLIGIAIDKPKLWHYEYFLVALFMVHTNIVIDMRTHTHKYIYIHVCMYMFINLKAADSHTSAHYYR